MPRSAFLFPGQGAQTVGMSKELCDRVSSARRLFEQAAEILGYDLLDVCVNGPAERLNATDVSQPALYVAGMAALTSLPGTESAALNNCVAVAGLSLGEYTALAVAGALDFADGLHVVDVRGRAMQAAAEATPSAMASVVGPDAVAVQELCAEARAQIGRADSGRQPPLPWQHGHLRD